MKQIIKKWSVSQISVNKKNNIYDMRGLFIVQIKDNKIFKIPFGAQGCEYDLTYEKCISEMCERATWFVLFLIDKNTFMSTEGFAAHILSKHAKINAILEHRERYYKDLILSSILDKDSIKLQRFNIIKTNENISIYCKDKLESYYYLTFRKSIINNKIGLVIGMGKSFNCSEAYNHSIEETLLVESALNKYISNEKNVENILLKKELDEYYYYFCNKTLLDFFEENKDSKINNLEAVDSENISVYNVTKYMPDFLKKYKRYVYYGIPNSKKTNLLENLHL